jgi:hypothetical protein
MQRPAAGQDFENQEIESALQSVVLMLRHIYRQLYIQVDCVFQVPFFGARSVHAAVSGHFEVPVFITSSGFDSNAGVIHVDVPCHIERRDRLIVDKENALSIDGGLTKRVREVIHKSDLIDGPQRDL